MTKSRFKYQLLSTCQISEDTEAGRNVKQLIDIGSHRLMFDR
jgi:hypothetical protein